MKVLNLENLSVPERKCENFLSGQVIDMTQEFYALGENRTAQFARAFLDRFLSNREGTWEEYPIPQYSDIDTATAVLTSEDEIFAYLELHPNERYTLYWDDMDRSTTKQAMLFYTTDGQIVYGLAESTESPAERWQQLAEFVGAEYYMFGWEAPPPFTAKEFIELCKL